ncbi:domain found in IF2B/IF5-domain-containing protein [Chytriomyces cf. hyalinus JEL632]|nr:domain found in IF2B/IF5-domain-containing protein [Chytriomyces cf. hyalinus JEL632]
MSNMINVRSDVQDKFYRYKMPKLISKIEGKGNGIKTVIPNMSDIAKALSRPPSYPTKFFGSELGAQTKVDEKLDRYIINGAHDAAKLQNLLDSFIKKFVLCPSCLNPETDLIIQKDETITRNCQACGANLPVDMRHKLCVFIIKNPPAISQATAKRNHPVFIDLLSLASLTTRPQYYPKLTPPLNSLLHSTLKNRAVKAANESTNRHNLNSATANDNDDEGNEAQQDAALEEFATFVTDLLATGDPEADIAIIDKAEELGLKHAKACLVLVQVIFTADMLLQNQVTHHGVLLHHFVNNEKAQKALLGGIERLVSGGGAADEAEADKMRAALFDKVALVLKAFYDEELLDEDVCLAWGEKVSKKYVDKKVAKGIREKAEPFLHWLRTADVAAEEEDD